jgi:hypothetical protein
MFIGIGSHLTTLCHNLEYGIDSNSHMRIYVRAFSINDRLGKMCWVNSSAEEQVIVEVNAFVVDH